MAADIETASIEKAGRYQERRDQSKMLTEFLRTAPYKVASRLSRAIAFVSLAVYPKKLTFSSDSIALLVFSSLISTHYAWSNDTLPVNHMQSHAISISRQLLTEATGPTISSSAIQNINNHLTICPYSKKIECLKDPWNFPELGTYRRAPGQCITMGSTLMNFSNPMAAQPISYFPVAAAEAKKFGYRNTFHEWSGKNQEQFQIDCPLLYDQTISKGQKNLCCTENQYEELQSQIRMIPGLCTSCKINLRNVWCQFACNPSNSIFLVPEHVRFLPPEPEKPNVLRSIVEQLTYYVSMDWVRDLHDYCIKDASFSLLCNPNSGCKNGFGLLDFMGQYKMGSIGSTLKINFKSMEDLDRKQQKEIICPCDGSGSNCISPLNNRLQSCVNVCGSLCAVTATAKRPTHRACYDSNSSISKNESSSTIGLSEIDAAEVTKWAPLLDGLSANLKQSNLRIYNICLISFGTFLGLLLIAAYCYAMVNYQRCAKHDGIAAAVTRIGMSTSGRSSRSAVDEKILSPCDFYLMSGLKCWGIIVSTRPYLVIGVVLGLYVICAAGLHRIQVETDPVKLWVSENSRAYKERDHYGKMFMPFYRSEQILMIPKDGGIIGRREYIKEAIRIQEVVAQIRAMNGTKAGGRAIHLQDLCWKATGTDCTVQSITQYFQNNMEHFAFYDKYGLAMKHFSNCLYSPENTDIGVCSTLLTKAADANDAPPASMADCPCLSSYGTPMNLYNVYLGGYPSGAESNPAMYLESKAFVSTALLYNYHNAAKNAAAIKWERAFIDRMKREARLNGLFDIHFMAEISIQDEIATESTGDITPVLLSYSLMIVYVSLGINRWSFNRSFFITSKMTVGFLGIVCIILAVSATIGVFMWMGAKLQLVIIEVVPFLALAIGVDNIFLIVHAMDEQQLILRREEPQLFFDLIYEEDPERRTQKVKGMTTRLVSEGLQSIGPSIAVASMAESAAFTLGCISSMPVVRYFAAFSAGAVLANFFFQMTLLAAIITLDKRRELSGSYDIFFCFSHGKGRQLLPDVLLFGNKITSVSTSREHELYPYDSEIKTPQDEIIVGAAAWSNPSHRYSDTATYLFDYFVEVYAGFLFNMFVKLVVLLSFLGWTFYSISSLIHIESGLPQAESMPSKSYMIDYFNAIDTYLQTGPPIYFVVEGGYKRNPAIFDLEDRAVQAKFCRSKDFCEEYSIAKIIDALANKGDKSITHISPGTTYSWEDDFWGFVNPDTECCRVDSKGVYLPVKTDDPAYKARRSQSRSCLNPTSKIPPLPKESFMSLFSIFATASAGSMCSYGGGSIYRGQFSLDGHPVPLVNDLTPQITVNKTMYGKAITAFSYMVVSTANPTQQSYIDSYKQARFIADWISLKTGVDVWVYANTFVFFDQYLTIQRDALMYIAMAICAIFGFYLIYFNFRPAYPLVIAGVALNIVLQVAGLMRHFDIMLNGLSVVNLIIAGGVGVEFSAHFVRLFAKMQNTISSGDERSKVALRRVLISILFGITITKLIGLSALTLADSRIFQKYYFRMYMAIVLCGVLNGVVFLPVVLSVGVDIKHFMASKRSKKNGGLANGSSLTAMHVAALRAQALSSNSHVDGSKLEFDPDNCASKRTRESMQSKPSIEALSIRSCPQ